MISNAAPKSRSFANREATLERRQCWRNRSGGISCEKGADGELIGDMGLTVSGASVKLYVVTMRRWTRRSMH